MKISHGFEYIIFWSLAKLVQLLPGNVADLVAVALGKLAYRVLTSRRRVAMENLDRAFKGEKSKAETEMIARNAFISVSRTSIEFARFPVISRQKMLDMIPEYSGQEYIDKALNMGRGVIFISGHLGNWELMGAWVAITGYATDFLVGQQHNPYVDGLLNFFRKSIGVKLIPIGIAARHVIQSLRENRIVVLVSDQHSASGGVVVNFFGRPASTPKGPAAFAVKVGCPIILGSLIRIRHDKHRTIIQPPVYPPNSGDKEKDIHEMTQKYTSQLESVIKKYPDQWMWTHRRWKMD